MKTPPTSPYRTFISCRRAILVLAGSVAGLIAAPSARAANATWTGAGGDNTWTTNGNWTPAAFPGSNSAVFTSADTATFGTVGSGTINLGGTINILNIAFGGQTSNATATTIGANAFTIGTTGNVLNLTTAGAITINPSVTSTQTIAAPTINLSTTASATYAFTNNSATAAAKLNVTGNVVGNATGTVLTLSGTNGGTVSGAISSAAGALALSKYGSGTWALTGANTYSGTTIVSGGTLDLGGGTATGSIAGTVLQLGNLGGTNASGLGGTLAYTRTGGATQSFTTTNLGSGASAVTTTLANQTVNLGAISKGVGATLDISGPGSVTTSATNNNGILGAAGAGGYATVNGTDWAVSNGTGAAITAYNAYTPSTAATTTLTAGSNVDFQASNTTAFTTQSVNSLRFNTAAATTVNIAAASTFDLTSGGVLVTGAVGANTTTIGAAGTDARLLSNSNNGGFSFIQNNTAGDLVVNAIISSNNGSDGLTKSGAGTLVLNGANTYLGRTIVGAGTVRLGNALAFGAATSTSTIAFATGSTLDFNGVAPTLAAGRVLNLFGGFTNTSGTAVTFASNFNGAANANNTGFTGALNPVDGTGDITFSGNLNAARFVKNGTNTLTLSGAGGNTSSTLVVNSGRVILNKTAGTLNDTTGADGLALRGVDLNGNVLTINGGTVQLGASEQIRSTSDAATGIVAVNGGTFDVNGQTETINGLQVGSTDGSTAGMVIGGGSLIIGNTYTGAFGANRIVATNGTISANLLAQTNATGTVLTNATFTKNTAGTVTLTGNNTYTGGTTINGGTLRLNNTVTGTNSGTGTGNVTVNSGGILAGTGQIAPTGANGVAVNSGGAIAPGAGAVGILTFNLGATTGGVVMATGAGFTFTLAPSGGSSLATANASSLIVLSNASVNDLTFSAVGNAVTLNGGSTGYYKLFDSDLANGTQAGDAYTNLTYNETTGLVSAGLTSAGNSFYVGTAGNGGDVGDIYLQLAVVPEPGTVVMSMMGLGIFGVSYAVNRRRRVA